MGDVSDSDSAGRNHAYQSSLKEGRWLRLMIFLFQEDPYHRPLSGGYQCLGSTGVSRRLTVSLDGPTFLGVKPQRNERPMGNLGFPQ